MMMMIWSSWVFATFFLSQAIPYSTAFSVGLSIDPYSKHSATCTLNHRCSGWHSGRSTLSDNECSYCSPVTRPPLPWRTKIHAFSSEREGLDKAHAMDPAARSEKHDESGTSLEREQKVIKKLVGNTNDVIANVETIPSRETKAYSSDGVDDDATLSVSEKNYRTLHSALKQAIDRIERKYRSLESEFQKAKRAEDLLHRANLITSNLYQFQQTGESALVIQDWENNGVDVTLTLDSATYGSAQEEAEDLYSKARRMKRGSVVLAELLQQNAKGSQILYNAVQELERLGKDGDNDMLLAIKGRLASSASTTGINVSLLDGDRTNGQHTPSNRRNPNRQQSKRDQNSPIQHQKHTCRELTSPDGIKVLVGRNRRDNEYISFHAARGRDVWLHSRGCPGAHVLVRVGRGDPSPPPDETMQFAANLAAFYSDARTERKALITAAEPKHIQKPRGAPLGAVKLRRELGSFMGRPDDVPEELKLKRGESGVFGGDEGGSRSLGIKAKNRKRTLGAAKASQAKKRAERRQKRGRRNRGEEMGESDAD